MGSSLASRVGVSARFALLCGLVAAVAGLCPGRAHADPPPADLDRQAAAAWQQLEAVVDKYDATREKLRATRAELSALDARLAPLADQVAELDRTVGTIAAGMYIGTRGGPLEALLSTSSPRDMLDQLTMLDHIGREHARDIEALTLARHRYDIQRHRLTALARQQSDEQVELATTKAVIEGQLAQVQALRARAYGARVSRYETRDLYVPVFTADAAGRALRFAYQQIGKAYRWAAAGPDAYDCSGLVLAAWRTAGVNLPHSSVLMWATVPHIGRDQLRPGDLVFYYHDIHHVALYAGEGRIIEAPAPGERVAMHPINSNPVVGYGRVG